MEDNYYAWLKKTMFFNVVLVVIIMGVVYAVLSIYRENYSELQVLNDYENILYGSALEEGSTVKFDIIKRRQNKVVALGSSRVMQFRAEFFRNKDFYTMGGVGSSIDEVAFAWKEINTTYIPDVIILGVDPWWFNPNFKQLNRFAETDKEIFRKYKQLFRNPKVMKQIFHIGEIKSRDLIGGRKTVGLNAAVNGDGYRLSDGSYQYGRVIQDKKSKEKKFKETYERMERGTSTDRFVWCDRVSKSELMKFSNLLSDIKSSGAHLIVFLPPFPHEIYEFMDSSPHYNTFLHDYMNSTEKLCSDMNVTFYNFTDLADIGATDDETIDGFHGSETAYARILEKISLDKKISKYLLKEYLQEAVNNPIDDLQAIPGEK